MHNKMLYLQTVSLTFPNFFLPNNSNIRKTGSQPPAYGSQNSACHYPPQDPLGFAREKNPWGGAVASIGDPGADSRDERQIKRAKRQAGTALGGYL